MNKLVLPLLGLMFLCGVVSAYQITIDAPATLTVGRPLVVNGTTNFGIGTPIDVVLYRQLTSSTELKRRIAYVQSDHTFRVVFDTTNLEKGTYKVEVPASGLGDSVNMRLVELVDRSDEIFFGPEILRQEFSGTLMIKGTMADNKNAGVQVEVADPDGNRIYGPKYIPTDSQGIFSLSVPITDGGTYAVSFTDSGGYIGTKTITVTGGPVTTVGITLAATTLGRVSAHARSSAETPAYFEVKSGSGTMAVYTSSDIDWVIQYGDANGSIRTVSDRGELNPEKITVPGDGRSVYFKVYPFRDSDSGDVFLYAENARSIRVSPTVPALFLVPANSPSGASETRSPVSPLAVVSACCIAAIFLHFRNRRA